MKKKVQKKQLSKGRNTYIHLKLKQIQKKQLENNKSNKKHQHVQKFNMYKRYTHSNRGRNTVFPAHAAATRQNPRAHECDNHKNEPIRTNEL